MTRKAFTTTIDADIQQAFKQSCKEKRQTMSEVLEVVMKEYTQGQLIVKKDVSYTVERK